MKKATTIIDEVGLFSLFEYCKSHKQFLFRSHNIELKENSDILFSDVEYLDLPLYFSNPKIYIGNEDIRKEISRRFDLKRNQKVIVIEEDGRRYFVVAFNILFQKNSYHPQETSMPIKREQPLTEERINDIRDNIESMISEKGLDYVIENVIQDTGDWIKLVE